MTTLPAAVIQGGTIPPGWQPQAIPYQGIGPDGRVITQYFALTYTFTYQVGPPVLAVPQAPAVNRRQAPVYRSPQLYDAAPAPYAPGWNYQAPAMPPVATQPPPATVARYAPVAGLPRGPASPAPPPAAPPIGWMPSNAPPPPTITTPAPADAARLIELVVDIAHRVRTAAEIDGGLSLRATDEVCTMLKHPLLEPDRKRTLAEVLKISMSLCTLVPLSERGCDRGCRPDPPLPKNCTVVRRHFGPPRHGPRAAVFDRRQQAP